MTSVRDGRCRKQRPHAITTQQFIKQISCLAYLDNDFDHINSSPNVKCVKICTYLNDQKVQAVGIITFSLYMM